MWKYKKTGQKGNYKKLGILKTETKGKLHVIRNIKRLDKKQITSNWEYIKENYKYLEIQKDDKKGNYKLYEKTRQKGNYK